MPGYVWSAASNCWVIPNNTITVGNSPLTNQSVWVGTQNWVSTAPSNYQVPKIDKKFCETILNSKNYSLMASLADSVLKLDRLIFKKFEKAIIESEDFNHICDFIRSVNVISVSHLTDVMLNSYIKYDRPNKIMQLTSFAGDCVDKLNLKKIFKFANKTNNPECLQWIISSGNSIAKFEKENISFKKIENIFLKSSNALLIYQFSKIFIKSNRKKCFNRIRVLKDFVVLRLFLDIDDAYCKSMKNMS